MFKILEVDRLHIPQVRAKKKRLTGPDGEGLCKSTGVHVNREGYDKASRKETTYGNRYR